MLSIDNAAWVWCHGWISRVLQLNISLHYPSNALLDILDISIPDHVLGSAPTCFGMQHIPQWNGNDLQPRLSLSYSEFPQVKIFTWAYLNAD